MVEMGAHIFGGKPGGEKNFQEYWSRPWAGAHRNSEKQIYLGTSMEKKKRDTKKNK